MKERASSDEYADQVKLFSQNIFKGKDRRRYVNASVFKKN
jgi:hypothetical protein